MAIKSSWGVNVKKLGGRGNLGEGTNKTTKFWAKTKQNKNSRKKLKETEMLANLFRIIKLQKHLIFLNINKL
jgi:hypothetical protein